MVAAAVLLLSPSRAPPAVVTCRPSCLTPTDLLSWFGLGRSTCKLDVLVCLNYDPYAALDMRIPYSLSLYYCLNCYPHTADRHSLYFTHPRIPYINLLNKLEFFFSHLDIAIVWLNSHTSYLPYFLYLNLGFQSLVKCHCTVSLF